MNKYVCTLNLFYVYIRLWNLPHQPALQYTCDAGKRNRQAFFFLLRVRMARIREQAIGNFFE